MIQNYIKIVWRNLARQPLYSVLNLSCLVIGVAAALAILLYLDFELNFDRFHEKADRIYRVETKSIHTHDKVMDVGWSSTPAPLGSYTKQDYPAVEDYVRFHQFFMNETVRLDYDGIITEESHCTVAEPEVVDVFSFDFIHGDRKTALAGPNKIILSETLSIKMFGNVDPVGKIVTSELFHVLPDVDPNYTFIVNGVFRDFPKNSTLELDLIISAESDPRAQEYHFSRFSYYTYLLLHEGQDPDVLAPKLSGIYDKYLDPEIEPVMKKAVHELAPLKRIHLSENGGYSYIYIFAAIGLLTLLIAIISYINLATVQAGRRSMEIGVRKVMGSSRQQLIAQFLSESVFFSISALFIAVALLAIFVKPLNAMLGLQLDAMNLLQPHLIIGGIAILFFIGILGGSYPAFFLSSFQPISIVQGKIAKGVNMRRLLVAIQFAVVFFVLVSTAMIYQQLQFMSEKDLGFNHEHVLRIPLDTEEKLQQVPAFEELLKQSPDIGAVGTASFIPGVAMPRRPLSADNAGSREPQFVHSGQIDYNYLETMDIEIVDGRNYSVEFVSDATQSILVNQTLVESFELENPVGEKVRYGDENNPNYLTIVGVVEDFHQSSLHSEIAAQIFILTPAARNVSVKINQNLKQGIAHLEDAWNKIYANEPLEYVFFDDDLGSSYEADHARGKIFMLFSGITIFIAFLGLFGLASFITSQRIKEISIRRVLGAKLIDVIVLVSRNFLVLVALAAIPAFVCAWYFIDQWLQDFAYRTEINYLMFGLVLITVLILTFVVTSFHAVRATRLNPAETLKYA